VVAANLDEPRTRGDELAAQMFLSRAHLDRLVSAVGGEAPGRFRRRILLERAAYRLLTSDAGVLEVAVEAGYSSHEAFTRAFGRAYGAAPSVWRYRPQSVRLDAPNRVHFHAPGGLRLPTETEVSSMDLVVIMIEHHIWLTGEMIDRASVLTAAQLDSPIQISVTGIDQDPSIRSLLSRLVGQLDMWNHSMADRPYDFTIEDHETIGSMRARLATCGPAFLGHVRDACERGTLDDTYVDATAGTPQFFTYAGVVAHVLTYAAHRRTLVIGALDAAGITDLEDDPLAWEPVRPTGPTAP